MVTSEWDNGVTQGQGCVVVRLRAKFMFYEGTLGVAGLGVLTPHLMCPRKCLCYWLQGPHCREAKLLPFLLQPPSSPRLFPTTTRW